MTDEQLQRIHDIEYSCDSRAELAERIVGLEDENEKLRELTDCAECARGLGSYVDSIADQLKAENAKLREELAQWERLTAGVALPDYPITGFQPKDLERENVLLRTFVSQMYRDMQGVLDMSTDTVFVDTIGTLRDKMDWYMRVMADLGMPPADYEKRLRELGMGVDE